MNPTYNGTAYTEDRYFDIADGDVLWDEVDSDEE